MEAAKNTDTGETLETIALQSNKGKAEGIGNKIGKANIKNWKDQKLATAAFFEWQKKDFFKSKDEVKKTFPTTLVAEKELPDKWDQFEEDDPIITKGDLPKQLIENFNEYGDQMRNEYMSKGLSADEVIKRRAVFGPNKLPEKKKVPAIVKLFIEMTTVFSLLLWAAAVLCFVGYALSPDDMSNVYLASVIIGVVILTAVFAFWQNEKSDQIMDSFKGLTLSSSTVIRDGQALKVQGLDLVPGDVIQVGTGEKIPADIRVFEANNMEVDEAPLTGESLTVKKKNMCGEKGKENPLEAENLLFFSTLCKQGSCKGVIIKTGQDTFMGRIADLASSAEAGITTLQREIDHFIKLIATIAITFGIVFFLLGLVIQYPIITNLVFALGIIVANVPEGLMSTVTVSLAITARKLFRKNVLVKNLQSVETLGAITCICSDKTGTLTQNKMTVVHLWYDMEIKIVDEHQERIKIDGKEVDMKMYDRNDLSFELLNFSSICGSAGNFLKQTPEEYAPLVKEQNKFTQKNPRATFEQTSKNCENLKVKFQAQYTKEYNADISGRFTNTDPSESGILKFFEFAEAEEDKNTNSTSLKGIEKIRARYPPHKCKGEEVKMPFSSVFKFSYMLRRVPDPNNSDKYTFMLAFKGAPEQLIKRCKRYLHKGKEHVMTKEFRESFQRANDTFALKGERVIGTAFYRLDPEKYPMDFDFTNKKEGELLFPIDDLCFAGIVAMEDPPREGVRWAVQKCKEAGVKVIMVTGDQYLTAASIAYQIGIIEDLDDAPEIIQKRENLASIEEAEKKSKTIIISGDRLSREIEIDSYLSEDNPKKGQFLRTWLLKRDVVFARTSPEQKLIIVDGCQKLQHVVAVTGDGVNDSPAIKKADIGISMGKVGTDVAKDAADILLLDDHFPNIVKGIKQGRLIFDLLKKIIGYCLTSNIPELLPFLGFVVFAFPLPLTTILILCIDLGTDVYPNIMMAYERAEADLMSRAPRNVATDKLCTLKLFAWGYLFMGSIETSGCFLTYFVVMHDYGFIPMNLFFFAFNEGIAPNNQDYYNPYDDAFLGNSNGFISTYYNQLGLHGEAYKMFVEHSKRQVDWATEGDINVDLRMFYFDYPRDFWGKCRHDSRGHMYDGPVCYRVEALRHAQGAFLLAIVIMQISNANAWRTKTCSLYNHLISNHYLNSAFFVEMALICAILYIPGLNTGFGVRPIKFLHFVPVLGVFITHILWAEFHKIWMRRSKNSDGSPGFFHKYFFY